MENGGLDVNIAIIGDARRDFSSSKIGGLGILSNLDIFAIAYFPDKPVRDNIFTSNDGTPYVRRVGADVSLHDVSVFEISNFEDFSGKGASVQDHPPDLFSKQSFVEKD